MKYRVLIEQDEDGFLSLRFRLCQAAFLKVKQDQKLQRTLKKQLRCTSKASTLIAKQYRHRSPKSWLRLKRERSSSHFWSRSSQDFDQNRI
jgi:hypothetical protein